MKFIQNAGAELFLQAHMKIKEFLNLKISLKIRLRFLQGRQVGKSSITNMLNDVAVMETSDVSRIGRGRHTTRHSEIFNMYGSTDMM